MSRFLPFLCLLFVGCATPSAVMEANLAKINAAFNQQQIARMAVAGKEADLNRAAIIANEDGDKATVTAILDSQFTLTGPAPTPETVLRLQVADLQHDKRELLDNITTLQANEVAAEQNVSTLKDKVEALAVKDAVAATQEQQDNSWGGLSGLIRYTEKSTWTLIYVAIGGVLLILALRFASLWMPEIGLVLTGIEHIAAAGFHAIVAVLGPGVLDAAGWIQSEWASLLTPSKTTNQPTPQGT